MWPGLPNFRPHEEWKLGEETDCNGVGIFTCRLGQQSDKLQWRVRPFLSVWDTRQFVMEGERRHGSRLIS